MSKNILSEFLHKLGKLNSNAFVIQIGANDGISFDDTRGFLDMYKWPALLVEPIPEIFQELKDNFSDRNNYIFEQSAITNYDGPVVMLNVSRDTINKNDLHPGYKGMSALYPLKNGFGSDYERDIHVKNNLSKNITVNGITFDSLLSKHNITQFDVLICDAEGHDWDIFKQIDLEKYKPKIIRLEYMNLNSSEQFEVTEKLKSHNYEYEISGQDIDAVDKSWINSLDNKTLTLNQIIEKHGSDKFKSGYSHLYQDLFKHYRDKHITYLEIGLGTLDPSLPSSFCGIHSHYDYYKPAGILRAWKEYFSNAEIFGLDIAEDCMISEDRVTTFLGDSTDQSFCQTTFQDFSFDIVLDDGLHTSNAQLKTFNNFFSKVKKDGLYIIEDIGGGGDDKNFWVEYYNSISEAINEHEFFFGGNVLIVRKNSSNRGSLTWEEFKLVEKNNTLDVIEETLSFDNKKIEPTIINENQIKHLLIYLNKSLPLDGHIVELGCFVGESSKYFQKLLDNTKSNKQLFVYDSFEGLPEQGEWEKGTGWIPGSLKTSESILVKNFVQNNLKLPSIHKNWFKNIPDDAIPNKISFAFLDGDFYESIHDSLVKIFDKVTEGGYICFHDWDRPDLPGVRAAAEEFLKSKGYTPNIETVCDQVGVFCKNKANQSSEILVKDLSQEICKDLTIVSGLWNFNRVGRSWDQYLEHFDKFLKIPCNLFLWIPKSLESFVWERRSKDNTFIQFYELEDIKHSMFAPFWDDWQAIRNDPKWSSQSTWLPNSPQCKNEYYNPVVMSKMFFLNDAKILNPFNDNYLLWLDAGITQTVYENYFYDHNVLYRLKKYLDPFLFLSYPYEANNEIHGFDFNAINNYAESTVDYVCRGGLFGGHKDFISHVHSEYYFALQNTLRAGFAGTEESIFSILAKKSNQYRRYSLDSNGLIVKFVQALFDDNVKLEPVPENNSTPIIVNDITNVKTNLYFLTFNFPDQLEATIESLRKHEGFLTHPTQKVIIDNSTNTLAREGNQSIATKYGFEYISMDKNTGICGGRQFAADHFDASESDFYLFFEDDMTISDPEEGMCRNGFQKYIPNLYEKIHKIMLKENFDFLKLSFTEVYMDNNIQVSWYNVPQSIRESFWPDYNKLPESGLDPNCPRTQFRNIECLNGLSYISGEIYYANWPHITSRAGNKKMFINTKWTHPYEQTWMSHVFQETKKGNINPAILLASPVTHDRFKHYKPEERIEG